MSLPPDPNHPASARQDDDLALNSPTPATDVDTPPLAPDDIPLQQELPGAEIFVNEADEPERSWLSRLRTLKASWEKEHPRRRAAHEPVPIEGIKNLEQHLVAMAALRDVCASIDERLALVQEASGRVEAGVQRAEQGLADTTLHEVCQNIDARLERAEETLHRSERMVAEWLQEHSLRMTSRFAQIEEMLRLAPTSLADSILPDIGRELVELQRSERVVADGLQELSARMTARFDEVEETLRHTPKSVVDRMLPNIERQLMQTRMTLERTEEAVTDKTLHQLCQNIDARLGRTEDRLDRNEVVVTEWLEELSARVTARLADAEETIQRIERIVSTRPAEQPPTQQPPGPADQQSNEMSYALNAKRPVGLPRIARFALPVAALIGAFALGTLLKSNRGISPAASPVAASQVSTPVAAVPDPDVPASATTALIATTPPAVQNKPPASPRSTTRAATSSTTRPPRFVGTLSITSVPSGATVSINGKPAGKTPLRLRGQRAGSLAVQIAHDGFERWSAAVLVPADQLTQVSANLRASTQ